LGHPVGPSLFNNWKKNYKSIGLPTYWVGIRNLVVLFREGTSGKGPSGYRKKETSGRAGNTGGITVLSRKRN